MWASVGEAAASLVAPKNFLVHCKQTYLQNPLYSAPITMAMSCSSDSRRSPKPGALMATALNMPRSLFTTEVASASPAHVQ